MGSLAGGLQSAMDPPQEIHRLVKRVFGHFEHYNYVNITFLTIALTGFSMEGGSKRAKQPSGNTGVHDLMVNM